MRPRPPGLPTGETVELDVGEGEHAFGFLLRPFWNRPALGFGDGGLGDLQCGDGDHGGQEPGAKDLPADELLVAL